VCHSMELCAPRLAPVMRTVVFASMIAKFVL
jgi:hypothetical protein